MRGRLRRTAWPLRFSTVYIWMILMVVFYLLYNGIFSSDDVIKQVRPIGIEFSSKKKIERLKKVNKVGCSFSSLSPKQESLAKALKKVIAWPETPDLPWDFSLKKTSDPARSTFIILPRKRGGVFRIGDQLQVLIRINDFNGDPKTSGGDVLFARLYNPFFNAGVAGHVFDHLNGSYTAEFTLLWEGNSYVKVTLVHSSEAVTVLKRLTEEQPDRISFRSFYRSGSLNRTSICNVCLKGKWKLCNYTDLRTGEPWFCYKPNGLSCDARINHSKGRFTQNIDYLEEKLFLRNINLKVSIPSMGRFKVFVAPKLKDHSETLKKANMTKAAGYYYRGVWRALDGTTVQHFNNPEAVSRCLRGKVLHLYGDSTIRQWFEYLTGTLPDLKEFDFKNSKQSGPLLAMDSKNNMMLTYRCHGPPIRFMRVPVSQLRYIANELDGLEGGPNTVVVIGIWSHFSTFPIEVYIRRMLSIRKAVLKLLARAPDTLVVIRTANPKNLTLYETLTNSDWYSLQRDKVLRALFAGMNVRLVEAWEMSLAHNLPHSLHPQPPIIKNMIDVLLSYVCPQLEEGKGQSVETVVQ